MKRLVFAVLLIVATTVNAQTPSLTAKEKAEGWKLLFDGKSLAGWRSYQATTPPSGWRAINGELVREGDGGDLMTAEQYGDFDLRFEWKVTENGNSGVIYRIATTEEFPWQTGPEYQILHNAGHRDGKNPMTSAASNYAVNPPTRDLTRPVGEWNEGRIVARGNVIEHWLNGQKLVEYEIGSADWEARVKASKFAKLKDYGRIKRGYIALQDHGNLVYYRNIKIRSLDPS
ncbi:MAG TPA: DUF1080 domain-containing protein [Vicinamibacterales bacterium]|nr:DUF1080 domain-containing protein [Vicinamibacterales bacterium]